MPLGGGGGGGAGGGGIILRTPVDMFNGATRTAAETARDAAITDTAPFDDNPSLAIILTWPVVVTDTVYQVRRNDAWADITGVVRGPTGASGRNGVDGTDGTDGGDGAPGGGALSLVGTATLTITAANDDMFLAPGFDWPITATWVLITVRGLGMWMRGDSIYGTVNGVTASTAGTASAAATRRTVLNIVTGPVYIGRTAANGVLIEFGSANVATIVSVHEYIPGGSGGGGGGLTAAQAQTLINATPLQNLQGLAADTQIPATIMRDAELTLARVGTALGLTTAEVPALLAGSPTISGSVLSFTRNDGTVVTITVPSSSGTADGRLRFGMGAPLDTLGTDGDSYLDVDSGGLYERASGAYTLQFTAADKAALPDDTTVEVTVTTSEIEALWTTRKVLVAAPTTATDVIIVKSVIASKGGTGYALAPGDAGVLLLRYAFFLLAFDDGTGPNNAVEGALPDPRLSEYGVLEAVVNEMLPDRAYLDYAGAPDYLLRPGMPLQLFIDYFQHAADTEPTQTDYGSLFPNIGTATLTFKITYSIYSP